MGVKTIGVGVRLNGAGVGKSVGVGRGVIVGGGVGIGVGTTVTGAVTARTIKLIKKTIMTKKSIRPMIPIIIHTICLLILS